MQGYDQVPCSGVHFGQISKHFELSEKVKLLIRPLRKRVRVVWSRLLQSMDLMHPLGFESIEKQLWRNKQNDRPISDSEIKAVLSQLFKTDQWLPPAGHVSEDVTSYA
ncbi:hypothetical protein AVEN_268958-1 [Araneus ventricosus]|uniref:Uncharacterized protein n=1 Tax=Araneus ventricosus TaxID=182803 RepID=A0A4Y2I1R0_ARAVE|nr:hypothetical protein AVEN_268958-1 [Araneus ventricosus]